MQGGYGSDSLIFSALGFENSQQHIAVTIALLGVGSEDLCEVGRWRLSACVPSRVPYVGGC